MNCVRAWAVVAVVALATVGYGNTSAGALKQISDELKAWIEKYAEPTIYNGKPVKIEFSPWQVALLQFGAADTRSAVVCGGVSIDSVWVLTAAHCFFDPTTKSRKPDSKFYVGYNADDLTKAVAKVKIKRVVVNERYDPRGKEFDVALVRLDTPIPVRGFMRLPSQAEAAALIKPGTRLTTTGWGLTEAGVKSNLLLEVEVPVVGFIDCSKHYNATLPANAICAGEQGKDACSWDSGGPLFKRAEDGQSVQIGIVSYGNVCGRESPGVYTPVAAHLDWIAKTRSAK